jgi:hypothetical protein
LTQEQQIRYSFDIRAGTTNQDEPITQIDKTIIAFNMDAVIEYCKQEYDMQGMDEVTSDELSIFFEKPYLGQMSDHGNIHEVKDIQTMKDIEDQDGNIKEEYQGEYGSFRDIVEINGAEITQEDYQYMISGNYHNTVIDLTDKQN